MKMSQFCWITATVMLAPLLSHNALGVLAAGCILFAFGAMVFGE